MIPCLDNRRDQQKAKEAFKDVELREAWTSRIVMRPLKSSWRRETEPDRGLGKIKD